MTGTNDSAIETVTENTQCGNGSQPCFSSCCLLANLSFERQPKTVVLLLANSIALAEFLIRKIVTISYLVIKY